MQRNLIQAALIAAALLLSAGTAPAADTKPATGADSKAGSAAKAAATGAKAKPAKPAANVKPVDINSASKKELMKLPGIKEAEADKIIAGRPYLTKAHLVTHNIIDQGTYEGLKYLVVARQPPEPAAAKPVKK